MFAKILGLIVLNADKKSLQIKSWHGSLVFPNENSRGVTEWQWRLPHPWMSGMQTAEGLEDAVSGRGCVT